MQFRSSVGVSVLTRVLLLAGLVLSVLLWRYPDPLGVTAGSARQTLWLSVSSATTLVVIAAHLA
jgi:type VI secretion system protein ImpL